MKKKIHMGNKIIQELNVQKRSVVWLANKIEDDQSNLGKQLRSAYVKPEKLRKISATLKKDFFKYHSQQVDDDLLREERSSLRG